MRIVVQKRGSARLFVSLVVSSFVWFWGVLDAELAGRARPLRFERFKRKFYNACC